MQLSIKTPPELTLPVLEKCAVLAEPLPSHFVTDCAWQCLQSMDMPHGPFHPFALVEKYYHALGRENEILSQLRKGKGSLTHQITKQDRAKRAKEAARRLHTGLQREQPPKHLHLKISQGMNDLPKRIKEKATWLRLSPNALVMACVRDCLDAMDNPRKAIVPPPVVIDFWTISQAKLRPKAAKAVEAMLLESHEKALRERRGPILDTVVRLALAEQWDTSLKQILREAGVLAQERAPKG